ncbi:toxin-antitoxin system HicB family antitoxin [Corynebacterium freneyi]|uniref:type II toxin-antitoxin system HicB family antitoxin n=1 Tax=Corynebacterium freneyi TaxID=134034 RepID=UPI001E4760D6|nr:toxin-antitoxin system HicB family antitoxin [Corynebacterium freneyi]MDK8767956.1 toxin-antitoxin system HicB family antitoxin [Corynebacterium freneyi]
MPSGVEMSGSRRNEVRSDHYTYQVAWSEEDQEFVGTVLEFRSLSWLDADRDAALAGITSLVEDVIADMLESGEDVPLPYGERSYSGRFQVRMPPEVHRRLAMDAAREGISLNRLINSRLTSE